MILLSANDSRELDRLSQQKYGVPSYVLMTRAGEAVADALARRWPEALKAGVLVVAGKGNNGGDGLVAARRLRDLDVPVRVVLLAQAASLTGDAARAYSEFAARDGAVIEVSSEEQIAPAIHGSRYGAVIDAIFGIGLNAEVRGPSRCAIETINALGVPVVAVDIASGVNSDNGVVMGAAVRATVTVTFGFAKYGHVSYPGAEYCGELEIAKIGFAVRAIEDIAPRGRLLEAADIAALMRPRATNTHKGTYGHVLVVAGGRGKSGAAILASRGALRMGAGLVTAAIPEVVAAIVAAGQAELMTEPMPDRDGDFDAHGSIARLAPLVEGKNALVSGPGMGASKDTQDLVVWLIEQGTASDRPLLIDADGLNALALVGASAVLRARGPVVLTPHPGEMARLLQTSNAAVNQDRIGAARRLVDLTGAEVLLKGAHTVVATRDGVVHVNSSGNPGMATPGMGDVLSGIIGALLGQGMSPSDAVKAGVFIHGRAADRIVARVGGIGYLAGELAEELPSALSALMTSP